MMIIPKGEVLRYMGCGGTASDPATPAKAVSALAEAAIVQLSAVIRPRNVQLSVAVAHDYPEPGCVALGPILAESRGLAKNLAGCDRAVLLAATLGVEADQLLRRASVTDVAMAAALQAAAAAAIEQYCDDLQALLVKQLTGEEQLRPRFSPGYGDFSIAHQQQLLALLEAPKRIGLTLTDGMMLAPTKSVTAVIGIGSGRLHCPTAGCGGCGKADCAFKR